MANGDQPVTGLPQVTPNSPGTLPGDTSNGAGPVTGLANPGVKIDGKGTSLDPLQTLRSAELKSLGIAFVKGKAQSIINKLIGGFTIGGEGGNKEDVPTAVGNKLPVDSEYSFTFPGVAGGIQKLQEAVFGSGKPRVLSKGGNADPDTVNADDRKDATENLVTENSATGTLKSYMARHHLSYKPPQPAKERLTGHGADERVTLPSSPVSVAHDIMMRWAASNPDHQLFIVRFEIPKSITIDTYLQENTSWSTQYNYHLNTSTYQPNIPNTPTGWFFVHGATLPNEANNINKTPTADSKQRGGLVFPLVCERRNPQQELVLKMYETNASFADSIIRPWIILLGHKGLVARREQLKTNITVTCLTRAGYNRSAISRKEYRFYNAYPKSVAGETLSYESSELKKYIDTTWAFSKYEVVGSSEINEIGYLLRALKVADMPAEGFINIIDRPINSNVV